MNKVYFIIPNSINRNCSINVFRLPVRISNALINQGIETVGNLLDFPESGLCYIKNVGVETRNAILEIKEILKNKHNLSSVTPYEKICERLKQWITIPINELFLSDINADVLKKSGINTLGQLVELVEKNMIKKRDEMQKKTANNIYSDNIEIPIYIAIIRAISIMPINFGYDKIIRFLKGGQWVFISKYKLDESVYFGCCSMIPKKPLYNIIETLVKEDLIEIIKVGQYKVSVLNVTNYGLRVLMDDKKFNTNDEILLQKVCIHKHNFIE